MTMPPNLRDLGRDVNLDKHAEYLQTDEGYRKSCRRVINRLVRDMHKKVPVNIKAVIKAGSFGKGTALKDNSDIDLVVFLSDYHSVQDVKDKMKFLLDVFEEFLGRKGRCKIEGRTQFALKINFKCCRSSHEHKVDLLPACDVLEVGGKMTNARKRKVYEDMLRSDENLRRYFSASLVVLQRNFVVGRPAKLKSLIRLFKSWRISEFRIRSAKGNEKWPTSYVLELITIKKWEEAGCPRSFDLKRGFYSVLNALVEYNELQIVWYKHYSKDSLPSHSSPYVIDPANPFNNIYEQYNKWEEVADLAKSSLEWPLFEVLYKASEKSDSSQTDLNNWNNPS
ncbi:hypothetical protein CHS0354_026448 [Potamilus streckersoni]|uniref:2'-5' oligoadenylate synthase n=1 Tax=Potamilus streckersoni TaxID=2493646 RepID=A0AAE0RQ39_9BIVA|nr:hypothetical protein CHS0354_026448 [Potamilus streckersoni]